MAYLRRSGMGQAYETYGCSWWDIWCQAKASQAKQAALAQGATPDQAQSAAEAVAIAESQTSAWAGLNVQAIPRVTYGPNVAAAASPGLPEAYPTATATGAIPGNPAGATQTTDYGSAILADLSQTPAGGGQPIDWSSYLLWGLVALGAFIVLGGGRR